ncbi:MAG: SRPBCC family protein [Pseudomonadota bacterium]|nr:SRPBCC family protein [Pseudomonadota bacterium]
MKMSADQHDLVLERVLDVTRDLVWRAWSDPELLKQWWAPKPYETAECEMELRPGGKFYTRMTGPDGFDAAGTGCFLEVVEGEKVVWTSALLPGYRPAESIEDCGGFPFTAVVTFEDAGDGRTRYRAVALHRNAADRDAHAAMGFEEGWGRCADQLGELARSLV